MKIPDTKEEVNDSGSTKKKSTLFVDDEEKKSTQEVIDEFVSDEDFNWIHILSKIKIFKIYLHYLFSPSRVP